MQQLYINLGEFKVRFRILNFSQPGHAVFRVFKHITHKYLSVFFFVFCIVGSFVSFCTVY